MEKVKTIYSMAEAAEAGSFLVGGKGYNLGRLTRYSFPVPKGFILSTRAYSLFLEENNLQQSLDKVIEKLSQNNLEDELIEQELAVIREKIQQGILPEHIHNELSQVLINLDLAEIPLAIRSSASMEDSRSASFAGIHESFLNVTGLSSPVLK